MSVIQHTSQTTRPNEWSIAFTDKAKQWEIDQKIRKKYDSLQCVDSLNFNEKDEKNVYISWNDGKVIRSDQHRPYSTKFTSCLAILMRAQKNKEPCQLGLVHIFNENCVGYVREKLKEIAELTHNATIDFFISGGRKISKEDYTGVLKIVEEFNETQSQVIILDDKFGIADDLDFPFEANGKKYIARVGISYAGFNTENNPYLEIDVLNFIPSELS